ncbi:hypothetical protein [Catenuloplanes japonicus]|uniref:hypothetical protein n=1 Tax=Catenuloplanes japonicus TaxID=33876 RepID=UPI0005276602|nr:hypothetical protein [Catenuloplanes japonicus]
MTDQHALQGAGHAGDAYIAYGLGNLLFYHHPLYQQFSSRSGLLRLDIQDRSVVRADLVPVELIRNGRTAPLTGWRADLARRNFDQIKQCAAVT